MRRNVNPNFMPDPRSGFVPGPACEQSGTGATGRGHGTALGSGFDNNEVVGDGWRTRPTTVGSGYGYGTNTGSGYGMGGGAGQDSEAVMFNTNSVGSAAMYGSAGVAQGGEINHPDLPPLLLRRRLR